MADEERQRRLIKRLGEQAKRLSEVAITDPAEQVSISTTMYQAGAEIARMLDEQECRSSPRRCPAFRGRQMVARSAP